VLLLLQRVTGVEQKRRIPSSRLILELEVEDLVRREPELLGQNLLPIP
jgi:hypothetical protein